MPSGYNKKRLVGSITTDSSPAFRPVRKVNDVIYLIDPIRIVNTVGTFAWTTTYVGNYASQFAKKGFLRSYIDTSPSLDGFCNYSARPTYYNPTYPQYYHEAGVNAQNGTVSAYGHHVQSGIVDLEVIGTSDPPTVQFSHQISGSAATKQVWFVGFQELLPK